ncbi:MAG: NAD-dependent epimerase/dehydratase family protein [Nitrososphaerales archaeon]
MKKKILVTGSSGTAGQRISRDLVTAGFEVRMADMKPPLEEDRTLGEFVRCDTRTPSDVREAVEDIDAVIHLAAWHSAHVPPVSDATIFAVNVDGTFNLLEACRDFGIKSLVYASSLAYGWHSVYAVTKVIGEDLCRQFQETTEGASVAILRYNKFVPCSYLEYGGRLLENGVDLRDISAATVAALKAVCEYKIAFFRTVVVNKNDDMPESVAQNFRSNGPAWLEDRLQGSSRLIGKYSIPLPARIEERYDLSESQRVLDWKPTIGFLDFLRDLKKRDERGEDVSKLWVASELPTI